MNIRLNTLNANGDLETFKNTIKSTFASTVKKITAIMPVSNVDIAIVNNPHGAIPEVGVGGMTYNPHFVVISIDSKFPNLINTLENQLERSLIHELHHCARWSVVGYGKTLLEAMVTEGLALHFVVEVTSNDTDRWNTALTGDQMKTYFHKAKSEYHNIKYNHSAWFFGTSTDIPKWTGYSLGYDIINKYLKRHPDKKPSQLYGAKAEIFI